MIQPDGARQLLGHPVGIYVLALVEMWERFSYYGMRALLLLYLIEHLRYADADATLLYGAYTALVYGCAIAGGWIADRYVGQWRSVVWGASLIMSGHLGLAWQDSIVDRSIGNALLVGSLAIIVTGTGLFKPNSTTLVGRLYPDDDSRRTTGFHLFYLGINVGAAGAALACGALASAYGWGVGFGAAAVGMAFGMIVLFAGRHTLRRVADPDPSLGLFAVIIPLIIVALAFVLIQNPAATGVVLALCLAAGLALLARFMMTEATLEERKHLQSALILIGAAAIFWSLFEQAGSSLSLFAARAVDLSLGPITLSAPQTQVFNPAFIIMLTPLFALLWAWLAKRGKEPSVTWKHVAGLVQVGLGFVALIAGIVAAGDDGKVALGWLILAYFLHTTGELCLSPTAYQAMATLAPRKVAGLVMGLWLFSLSIGNFVGAHIATLVARPDSGVAQAAERGVFSDVFGSVVLVAGIASLLLGMIARKNDRWMRA